MMKVTCCCLTCIIGQEKEEQAEETSQLLNGEETAEGPLPVRDKQPVYSRSTSAVSSASTVRGLSTESGEPTSESHEGTKSSAAKEKFSKAVGVLKKYNVMSSKYNTKELQRQLSSPAKLRLKVGVKIMPRSSTVKISIIEAYDILPTMQFKGLPELGASTEQDTMVVQVRTKILQSEVRGHTRKYEIQAGVTGTLKLRNETIHTIDLEEFMHCKIRFRLYYVLKHQRDKLLGEYTLDVQNLNIDRSNTMTTTLLELSDPSLHESDTQPELVPVLNRMLSSDGQLNVLASTESQSSTDQNLQSTPKIQRQAKIHSQDSDIRHSVKKHHDKESFDHSPERKEKSEDEVVSKKPFAKAFKSIRQGASSVLSKDHGSKDKESSFDLESGAAPTEQMSVNERLRMLGRERTEKVEELQESTAAMAETASNFSALSVKLREKYMAQSGKKSKSSET